jgi:dihydrofolate reductase
MARNRVMGVNGKLPWDLPADRKHFVDLTRDKMLIMGRQTYEEDESKSHISHAGYNIVISGTIERLSDPNEEIARSFTEALHLAKLRMETNQKTISCWIVGGERIYDEALKHPSAEELHLTIVHTDIHMAQYGPNPRIAMFPAKYRWDRHFDEVSRSSHKSMDRDGNSLKCTHVLYRRKRSRQSVL